MITELEGLELAKKVLSLSNFTLKKLCREAQAKYSHIIEFDSRDNKSMREALWSLGQEKLKTFLDKYK